MLNLRKKHPNHQPQVCLVTKRLTMEVLKSIAYVVAAILVLSTVLSIGTFLAIASTIGGAIAVLVVVVAFVAFCIKEYVEGK